MASRRFPVVAILVLLAAFSYYRYHQSPPYLPHVSDDFSADLSSDGIVRKEGYDEKPSKGLIIPQREVKLWGLQEGLKHETDPVRKLEIERMINDTIQHRAHVDASIRKIAVILYGPDKGAALLESAEEADFVDDSNRFEPALDLFEETCGTLDGSIGLKHEDQLQSIIGAGVNLVEFEKACKSVCHGFKQKIEQRRYFDF